MHDVCMTNLKWEDPAPVTRTGKYGIDYRGVVEQLRHNPGKWALVAQGTSKTGANSMFTRFTELGMKCTRRVDGDLYNVFVMFDGPL